MKVIIETDDDYVVGALDALREAWKESGHPLQSALLMKRVCECGRCPGTTIGLMLESSQEAMVMVATFFAAVEGNDIKVVDHPLLKEGNFYENVSGISRHMQSRQTH